MKRNSLKIRKASSPTPASTGSGSSSNFLTQVTKHKGTLIKVALVSIVFIFVAIVWKKSTSVIRNLVNVDIEDVKNALTSETPYLFYCDRDGGKKERVPSIFTDLHAIKGTKMGFATVNCSQVLPSGKNLWERFKLRRDVRPTIFGTAPWMKAKQAEALHLKDVASLQKFVDVRMAPNPTMVYSDKELRSFCGFDKTIVKDENSITDTCLVIVKGKRHTKAQTDLIQKLVLNKPKLKIAMVDAIKNRLSIEDIPSSPADNFAIKVHALRNGTHFLTMQNPPTRDYLDTFVSHALGVPLYGYNDLDGEVIKLVKPVTPKKEKKAKQPAASKKKAPSSTQTGSSDSEPPGEGQPGITEEERIARERKAREYMERQEKLHSIEEEETEEEEEDSSATVDEDEESEEDVIEL
jgi:hypothetical protein